MKFCRVVFALVLLAGQGVSTLASDNPVLAAVATRVAPAPSGAVAWTGTGVMINPLGHVLTNKHVIDHKCTTLTVENLMGRASVAKVSAVSARNDLALLETGLEEEAFAYVRIVHAGEHRAVPLQPKELVHFLGFPQGELTPRGGFVKQLSDPKHGPAGATITGVTAPGSSGSPVLDDQGLLVGLVWGEPDLESAGDRASNVDTYMVGGQAIIDLMIQADIGYGASTVAAAPELPPAAYFAQMQGYFVRIAQVQTVLRQIVVQVRCVESDGAR